MRNLRLIIAYDGSRYHGWQHQPGLLTVEGRIVEVLSPITQTRVTLAVAGRTDAGVHARGQVANFHTASDIDVDRLRRAANSRLGPDVNICRADVVAQGFNARFNALAKHYRYVLWADAEKPPYWQAPYCFHWYRPLDLNRMVQAARHLTGEHDFKSFETTGSRPRRSTVCFLKRLQIRRRAERVCIDVEGDRFLYNMVRNLVGTLLEVGRGRMEPEDMPGILQARDRAAAGPTAPANGLTMMRVDYDETTAMPAVSNGPADP